MTITKIGLGALGLALAVAVASPGVSFAQGQDPAGQQDQQQQGQQRQDQERQDQQRQDQQQDQARQSSRTVQPIEGQLKAVGQDQQIVLVDRTSGEEVLFHYTEETQVDGKAGGVQGLAGQSGTMLRVHYRADGERAVAERIEIIDQGSQASPSDQQPGRQPEDRPQPQPQPEAPEQPER